MSRFIAVVIALLCSASAHALSVSGDSPVSGPISGGTTVTVTGSGFATTGTVTVSFGGVTTNATVFNSSALQCVTPAHAEGKVDVVVSNPDTSTGTLTLGYTFFDPAKAPTITNLSPTYGKTDGTTVVVITGTNFNGSSVTFGGVTATSITVDGPTQITATAPIHTAGVVDIVVTNSDTQSVTAASAFTYYAPPTISGITNPSGGTTGPLGGGQTVTITGTGFFVLPAAGQTTVTFGTVTVTATVINSTTLTCVTPAQATVGSFSVKVTNPDGQVSNTLNNAYTYEVVDFTWLPSLGTNGDRQSWLDNKNWSSASGNDILPPNDGNANITFAPTGSVLNAGTRLNQDWNINSLTIDISGDITMEVLGSSTGSLTIQSGNITRTNTTPNVIALNMPLIASNGMSYTGSRKVLTTFNPSNDKIQISGTNTYSGPTTIKNTIVLAYSTSCIPGRSAVTITDGCLDLRVGSTVIGSLSGNTTSYITNSLQTNPALVTGVDNTDSDFAGVINQRFNSTGSIKFFKVGSGIQTLSGNNLNANVGVLEHIVSSGTLLVTGSLPSSSTVTVNENGILAGTGTCPAVSTPVSPTTGGSIQPGAPAVNNGVGTFNMTSLNLSEGELKVQIAGFETAGTDYDKLAITNAFTLNARSRLTIDVAGLNTTGIATGVVTFGGISGTFDLNNIRLVNNPFGYIATVIYNATSIDIQLDPAVTTPAGITVVPTTGLITTQTGGTSTFTVVLNTQPTDDVTIALSSSNTNAGTVSPPSLTFTSDNWDQPQSVTVTGVNSGATGNVSYTIITAAAVSNDTDYSGLNADDVSVINRGNGIVVTVAAPQPLTTTESGGSATFTVKLSSQPNADVLIPITSSNPNEGQPSPGLLVFTSSNYNTAQTVTVFGVDDNVADGTVAYTVHVGPAITDDTNGYKYLSGSDVSFTNIDNECSVTSILPISGPITGGTNVTITGTNFSNGATVSIGGIAPSSIVVVNDTTITATTAAHVAGRVDVVVTNPGGSPGTLSGGFIYFDPALQPTVSGINPNSGLTTGGLTVTIAGSQFVTGASVKFGTFDATNVVVLNSTTISAVTPPINYTLFGPKDLTVTNPDTQSATLTNGFNYIKAPAPSITSINPATSDTNGGISATITGGNFVVGANSTTIVTIGGAAATSVNITGATTMNITVGPINFANIGSKAVVITNPDGQQSVEVVTFTYTLAAAPTLSSISPTSGSTLGGTLVTLTGTNFAAGALLSIGGISTNANFVSATQLTATTPPHAAGAVDVKVTNPDQQATGTLTGAFTYAAPVIVTNITPQSGPSLGQTGVTIAGSNFLSGATVLIGGKPATNVNVVTSSVLTCLTPGHIAGVVDVVVTNPNGISGTLPNGYTYIASPPPVITAIDPAGGTASGGTAVTITGTGFFDGIIVTFGTDAATNVVVVNSTTVTAVTPAHASGVVDITVTNVDTQTSTLTNGFNFAPPPAVSTVDPTSGPSIGGTNVTITGTGFVTGATVTFGGNAATNVVVVSATQITATTPAHAAGAVDVVVKNPDTQIGTLASGFTFIPPPVITSITPAFGVTVGGTAVTIVGTGFQSGATVAIGGISATSVTVVDATTINAVTGPHAFGTVDVVVTNPDTQVGTLTGGYIYNDPPVIGSPLSVVVSTVVVGQSVTFSIIATDPQGMPMTFTYDYGDGSTGTSPSHTYTAPGMYTIVVTISNGVSTTMTSVNITVKLAANLWVKKQSIKLGIDGKESWSAQYIYNADRTPGNIFEPSRDQLIVTLGTIKEINITPPTTLAGTKPKFTFKSAKGVVPAVSVTLDESSQTITVSGKSETITDTVPAVLRNTVTLGAAGFSLDESFNEKGAFVSTSGYRTTAFVVAAAKVSSVPGKASALLSMLMADPAFAFSGTSGNLSVKVTNSSGTVILDKDLKSLAVFSNGKLSTGKDTAVPAGKFIYDSVKGKMMFSLKGGTLNGLANTAEHVTVDVTLGDKTYSTGVTLFAPKAGAYSTKLPK